VLLVGVIYVGVVAEYIVASGQKGFLGIIKKPCYCNLKGSFAGV